MNQKLKSFLGDKDYLGRRYTIFMMGLFICSFGVACTTKAGLGTSPVAAIPYTMSLVIPKLSLGNWLIALCMVQIIAQIIMLRKNIVVSEIIMQAILAFAFGYLTDFSLFLMKDLEPNTYFLQLIFLLIGCCILAFGVYLELLGNVVMLSGDAFIKAIAIVSRKEYGNVKIITDISMSAISAAISLVFMHKLVGVREGTLIAALIVGIIIKFYQRLFKPISDRILPEKEIEQAPVTKDMGNGFVITISREYGSGGRNIGKMLANKLGITCYDAELIKLAAEKAGMDLQHAEQTEQKIENLFLYDFYAWYSPEAERYSVPDIKKIRVAEENVIRELYEKEPCVIVGRQANAVLKGYRNVINIFISADMDEKIRRIVFRDGLSEEEATKKIHKVDKERKNYCKEFYQMEWGNCSNYDLSFNASRISADSIVDTVLQLKNSFVQMN
ncbi:DUF6198 family protein [Anaerotignum sp.]